MDWSEQKSRYDHHKNEIENPGYVQFFEQLLKPLKPEIQGVQEALDWGSGPGDAPVLSQLLEREGIKTDLYDPIYQNEFPQKNYELITCTEVVEHFQNPKDAFDEILKHLKKDGIFAGLTNFHQGAEKFKNWWYVKDPTHVVFYSEKTFHWIADKWKLEVLFLQTPVFIFKKRV